MDLDKVNAGWLQNVSFQASPDGERTVGVFGHISDHPDPVLQKVSIDFRFEIDAHSSHNAAKLRAACLKQLQQVFHAIELDLDRIGNNEISDLLYPPNRS